MKKIIYLLMVMIMSLGFIGTIGNVYAEDGDGFGITDGDGDTDSNNDENPDADETNPDADETNPDADNNEGSLGGSANEDDEEYDYNEKSSNPNTGLNDYIMYVAPVVIIAGSTLIIKRNRFE